jgi:hypothetical protein
MIYAVGSCGGDGGFASSSTTRLSRLMLVKLSISASESGSTKSDLASSETGFGGFAAVGVGDVASLFGEPLIRSAVFSRLKALPKLAVLAWPSIEDCSGAEELSIAEGHVWPVASV